MGWGCAAENSASSIIPENPKFLTNFRDGFLTGGLVESRPFYFLAGDGKKFWRLHIFLLSMELRQATFAGGIGYFLFACPIHLENASRCIDGEGCKFHPQNIQFS
jgi:hypothetical protein